MGIGLMELSAVNNQSGGSRTDSQEYSFARDVAETLISEYATLVVKLSSPHESAISAEFAYERLLGARGALCRICPPSLMHLLYPSSLDLWRDSERKLAVYFEELDKDSSLFEIARKVEDRWTSNVERFVQVMSAKALAGELRDQIGMLRGIDSIALHLAQRELFRWSEYFNVPNGNAQALKLRIRLFSLYISTQRQSFGSSYLAIRSYRETFGILDRQAYPWWFVDCDLTERQMNWTYRRLSSENLGWRF